MDMNIPRNLRLALYIFTSFGSLVVTYLAAATEYIGTNEIAFWTGFVSLVAAMAGFNITPTNKE